jgi:phage shock protein E
MIEVANKTTIVDVRNPDEYGVKNVPGAINIPLDEIARRLKEFKVLPQPIIVYCRSGNRSEIAVTILKQAGITDVINGGGLEDMLQLYGKKIIL